MTKDRFWEILKEHLDTPFTIDDVISVEWDPAGVLYFNTKDGKTFALGITEVDQPEDDEL